MFYIKTGLVLLFITGTIFLGYDMYKESQRIIEQMKFERQLNQIRYD